MEYCTLYRGLVSCEDCTSQKLWNNNDSKGKLEAVSAGVLTPKKSVLKYAFTVK